MEVALGRFSQVVEPVKSVRSARPLGASRHPANADSSVLLSAYIYEMGESGERERARRTLQEDFIRSGGSSITEHLGQLRQQGWLRIPRKRVEGRGNVFTYGKAMSSPRLRRDWEAIAERIWGPTGYLSGWMGDPLFAHGALGWSGTLVYAVCLRYPAPFSAREIQDFFVGVFSPDQTAYRVRRLRELGIIVRTPEGYQLNPECQAVIETLRERFQGRKTRITYSNAQERKKYKASVGRSDRLDGLRLSYKARPCIRCKKTSNEVEHFPPVKWSGESGWFLTFPICRACNGKTSQFIRENMAPRPLTVRKVSLIGGNPLGSLEERIDSYRKTFYSCVESGQAERAMKAVAKARATFEAHTGDSGALIFRLPSGVDFHLDPKRHGLFFVPTLLSTEKPTFDPNLTRVPIRKKGPNPMRTRGKNFKTSDKSK